MPDNRAFVAVIDYGMGNLFSVRKACEYFGVEVKVTANKAEILGAGAVILPGVGAFGDAMANLEQLDLVVPIKDFIASGKPFFGVCLGMQLLFSESEEFGAHKGLGIVEGVVKKLPSLDATGNKLKVPQVGWNRIFMSGNAKFDVWAGSVLEGVSNGEFMYFVHSYYAVPEKHENIFTRTTYGGLTYCSGIHLSNVYAFQFHPEKSATAGLKIYGNFCKMSA